MDERAFVLEVRKYRWPLLLAGCTVFAVVACFVFSFFEHGSARVAFMLHSTALIKSADNEHIYQDLFTLPERYEKQRLLIHSDDMVDHLARTFDLYTYYDIDPDGAYAQEQLHRAVTSRITVEKKVMDVIVISYADRSSRMAVDILNEMMRMLETLNRRAVNERHRVNMEIYDATRRNLELALQSKQAHFNTAVSFLHHLYDEPMTAKAKASVFDVQLELTRQTEELVNLQQEMIAFSSKYELEKASVENDRQPIVHVLIKALPSSENSLWQIAGIGFVSGCAAIAILLALLYHRDRYEWVLRTLFR